MYRKLIRVLFLISGIFLFSVSLKAAPPAAPGILQHVSNTTSSITWTWQDNSNDEQGFRCYEWYWDSNLKRFVRSSNPVWSVNANITSYTETGLAPNTQYRRVIVAWKGAEESPQAFYDSSRGHYYYFSPAPDYPKPDYLVAYYTSIESPAGLEFGPKGMDALTVRLTAPLPSNLTATGSYFGYFVPNDSAFYIEELNTGKGSPWLKDNNDYDPLGSMTGASLSAISWEKYLKNGTATFNSSTGQYSSEHKWQYYCFDGLEPNSPYKFRAKARNGDSEETSWCNTSQEVWTLPLQPKVKCDKQLNVCYDPGTKFTFTSLIPFGVGTVDHYHIMWTTKADANPDESATKWSAGDWIITENRLNDWYLVIKSHNVQHEEPVTYERARAVDFPVDGTPNLAFTFVTNALTGATTSAWDQKIRNQHIITIGPFKIGYEVTGKVTISGGTGSYTDVVVHCGGYTTNCNSLGAYNFKNLPPGTYDLYVELPGYRIAYPVENGGHYSIKLGPASYNNDFTLAYKNTYTIAGKITITGGSGVVPSDVTITCGSYTPVHPDANWNYFIPGVFAGTYKVKATISNPDYEITFPSGGEYTVSVGPDATGRDFVFTYIPGTDVANISGTVKLIGGTGDPTKATVYCKNLNSGITGQANPDHTGKYSFSNLPKGKDYQLWVKMDGYKLSRVRISDNVWSDTMVVIPVNNLQDDQQNKDFELVPISYYSVSGKVDVAEGVIKPPDVKVHCDCLADTSISFAIHPDTNGTYNFSSVPEGTYRIYLEIPQGYKVTNPISEKYDVTVGPDASGKNFLVEPLAKYSVSGKITLSGGTCGPYESLVVCQYYNSVKKDYITFTTIPDSSGNYKFSNLVPANYTLHVSLTGYQTVYPSTGSYVITITNKDITGKDFYLVSYAIKGNVSFITSGNESITNVTIICSATSNNPDIPNVYVVMHPDESGNYAFYNLVPSSKLGNPYRVEVKLAGYGCISPATGYYDVNITSKDEVRNFILATYSVSGKLTLYSGSADLTKATVIAAKLDKKGGNEIDWIVTSPDANGQYQITGIVPGSYYRIRVKLQEYYSLKPREGGLNWGYEVYIPPSATNLDFLMMPGITPGGYTISGNVTVSGGTVKPDQVIVHCGDYKTYPDGYGNYYFKNLNAGTYDVYVERLGYRTTFPVANGGHYYVVLNDTNPEVANINFTIAPEPVPTYKISGTVTLAGGTGVVTSVTVHCKDKITNTDKTINPDINGKYSFTNLSAGSYELWVELPKYVTSNPGGSGRQTVKLYDRDVAGVDFTMQAIPTYSISGVVSITDGDVTQVQIICSSGAIVNPDAFGRYMITDLLAGTYEVHAEMPGYLVISPANNLYKVKLGPDAQNCNFTIVKTYTISGKITLSGGTGKLSSVVVYCNKQTTKPDATGYYEFTQLLPGNYEVSAKLDGYSVTTPASGTHKVTLGPDASLKDFTLNATTLLSVSGKVTLQGGTGKVTDVVIRAAGLNTSPDENGNYTLSGLSPGTYDLTADLTNYTTIAPSGGTYKITLTNRNISGYNFVLATYKISGTVKITNDADVQTVTITCEKDGSPVATTHPDASGYYEFSQLPAGTYKISASLTDYSTMVPSGDGSYTVTLGPDATGKNFSLISYVISGRVSFYQTSGNVTDVVISLKGPGVNRTTTPDENGYYQFKPVPKGDYELSANIPNYTVVVPNNGKYTFTLNSNLTRDFVITSFYISGKVTLLNSPNTVTNVTITLTGPSGTINTSPDATGKYVFSPLPAGAYTITASLSNHTVVSPSGGSHAVSIPQNATGRDFTLVAYSISGTVKVNDTSGPVGAIVYCEGPSGTMQYTVDSTGVYKFYPLAAGNYRLWVEKPGYKTTYPSDGEYNFRLSYFAIKNFVLQLR